MSKNDNGIKSFIQEWWEDLKMQLEALRKDMVAAMKAKDK